MAMEIEIGKITAFDNVNGKGILGSVDFIDHERHNQRTTVNVMIPLDKDAKLSDVEARILDCAKQQLRDLVATF
ncbi:hypothetical protein [Pantoea agglomerans]|uniref:hypothetical protein n=1 Tax=Enterobacter agglomerans TaxID=549 RepID=UPI00320AC447